MNVTYEYIGANFLSALVLRSLIDLDGLAKTLYHVQDFDGIVGILLGLELNESVALMFISDLVSWYMHIYNRSTLKE
jgi:hypothetical protein